MRRWLSTSLLAAATLALTLVPNGAAAGEQHTGYICSISFNPATLLFFDGTYGKFGYVTASLKSEPNCKGTSVTVIRLCSTGATNLKECSPSSLYTEAGLHSELEHLHQAAAETRRVNVITASNSNVIVAFLSFIYN